MKIEEEIVKITNHITAFNTNLEFRKSLEKVGITGEIISQLELLLYTLYKLEKSEYDHPICNKLLASMSSLLSVLEKLEVASHK